MVKEMSWLAARAKAWESQALSVSKTAEKESQEVDEDSLVVLKESQELSAVVKEAKMKTGLAQIIDLSTLRMALNTISSSLQLPLLASYRPQRELKWHRPEYRHQKSHQPLILISFQNISAPVYLVFSYLNAHPYAGLCEFLFDPSYLALADLISLIFVDLYVTISQDHATIIADLNDLLCAEPVFHLCAALVVLRVVLLSAILYAILFRYDIALAFVIVYVAIVIFPIAVFITASFYHPQFACVIYPVSLSPLDA